jgi:structural maintenance of chromosome 3 (chondroitin sulfate proteoglycan 6)
LVGLRFYLQLHRLAERERRVTELYSKQGRGAQFKTKKERDDWIKKEVKQIASQIAQQQEQVIHNNQY